MRVILGTPERPASSLLRAGQCDVQSSSSVGESELLAAIRAITNRPRDVKVSHSLSTSPDGTGADLELAWTSTRVVVSVGSCIQRQWCFEDEEEDVQFACWAYVEHAPSPPQAPTNASSDAANATATSELPHVLDPNTFGPFARCIQEQQRSQAPPVRERGLFVFLRSTGRVFLDGGAEYTFFLPFVTKRAWPMYPRGVLIERVARHRRSDAPMLYALTDPLAEVLPVGMADTLSRKSKEPQDFSSTLPSTERVLTVVEQEEPLPCSIIVTMHGRSQLTLWRVDINSGSSRVPELHISKDSSSMTVEKTRVLGLRPTNPSMSVSQNDPQAWNDITPKGDLSLAMDRMALASRAEHDVLRLSMSHTRLEGGALLAKLFSTDLPDDCSSVNAASAFVFSVQRCSSGWFLRIGVSLRAPALFLVYEVRLQSDMKLEFTRPKRISALSAIPIHGVRSVGRDAIILKPDRSVVALTHGLHEFALEIPGHAGGASSSTAMDVEEASNSSIVETDKISDIVDPTANSFTLVYEDGSEGRVTLDLCPRDDLTRDCFAALDFALPSEQALRLLQTFIAESGRRNVDEFTAFTRSLNSLLGISDVEDEPAWSNTSASAWDVMGAPEALYNDPALVHLAQPILPQPKYDLERNSSAMSLFRGPILFALHLLGQDYSLCVQKELSIRRLAPLIIRLSIGFRPAWADYWVRISPTSSESWIPARTFEAFDALPHLPPDLLEHLRASLLNQRVTDWPTLASFPVRFSLNTEVGVTIDPLRRTHQILHLYSLLSDQTIPSSTRRCEHAVQAMIAWGWSLRDVEELGLGVASPIREALRACQLSPPVDWPTEAYVLVGRSDLARMSEVRPIVLQTGATAPERRRVFQIVEDMRTSVATDVRSASGVELNIGGFTDIRFGQDRRLHEVARMLQSSNPASVTMPELADISEHDVAREQQQLVLKVSERTLALPLGRALFTFGTVSTVMRDAYVIPKLDLDVRIQHQNAILTVEIGKLSPDSKSWAEFHNGVAAGLRISPATSAIDSSWIASNKPSDLSPQHAGFLFGLGLTGHLKSMLTWHTFAYLTPKHDLTSVGVLLGLASANVGTANRHVTKLIAVHTPALLPSPSVDLNVPLTTQAAGLAGLGLLYLGTGHRHMAEVALIEIGRRGVALAEPSQDNREAYALSAALAFGMIMIGVRSPALSPADLDFVNRLRTYIHGLPPSAVHSSRPHFNINLTSPAATIALGLMFLKSERSEIAEVVTLPNIATSLDNIPPNFLLLRTLSRCLILWKQIGMSREWVVAQIPQVVLTAMAKSQTSTSGPLDLAYYNIVAGACWAMGLKYAGSAQKEAHDTLLDFFDTFTLRAEKTAPSFEQKIRRAAIQDALNVISISIGLVMAGTGDVSSLRRLRIVHGQATQSSRYGVHAAAHISMGLLFLGGGRYTLGTSNAAIACMVAAFFPRFPRTSADGNGYVQALRHLWVLAVEPRCLIACDVDTAEVVYLPIKLKVKDQEVSRTTHLVSPTLIPTIDSIQSILVDSPRYWPLFVDVANVPRHRAGLLRTQTLFVKKKTGFLSYGEDPKGSRSIVLRPGTSGASVLATPYVSGLKWTLWELHNFVRSLRSNKHLTSYLDHLCRRSATHSGDHAVHLYAAAILLECLTLDKLHMLHTHMRLFKLIYEPAFASSTVSVRDFTFADAFYRHAHSVLFPESLAAGAAPLLSSATVADVNQSLRSTIEELCRSRAFRAMLATYTSGSGFSASGHASQLYGMLALYLVLEHYPNPDVLVNLQGLAENAVQSDPASIIHILLSMVSAKLRKESAPSWSYSALADIISVWNIVSDGS